MYALINLKKNACLNWIPWIASRVGDQSKSVRKDACNCTNALYSKLGREAHRMIVAEGSKHRIATRTKLNECSTSLWKWRGKGFAYYFFEILIGQLEPRKTILIGF